MKTTWKETTIVGVAVFIAIIAVLWIIFYLQGYLVKKNIVHYHASFEHVGLLMTGDDVTVAGVPVGRVESIELEGRKAEVRFYVSSNVQVTGGTVAVIDIANIYGEAYLKLLLGEGPLLEEGSSVRSELAPGLWDMVGSGVAVLERSIEVIDQAKALIARLDSILGPESSVPGILENTEAFMANTRRLSENFDRYGVLLEETMVLLDSAAAGFRGVVDENAEGVKNTLARVELVSARLDSIIVDIDSGRGTLGRLLRDDILYEELKNTALEARNLIREIRENPEKFIRLKVF